MLTGVVGETMDATLMLLVEGETRGCGIKFVDVLMGDGDGVLLFVWADGGAPVESRGVNMPTPRQDVVELCLLSVLE